MKTISVPADLLAQVSCALKLASAVCIIHSPTIHERTRAAERALDDAVAAAARRKA